MPAKKTQGRRKPATPSPSPSPSTQTPAQEHPIGTEITISDDDRATLSSAADPLQSAMNTHSKLRRQFLQQEQIVLGQITKAEQSYHATLVAVGGKYEVKMGPGSGQNWNYGGDSGVLKRLG
jgi:hypothetical protein